MRDRGPVREVVRPSRQPSWRPSLFWPVSPGKTASSLLFFGALVALIVVFVLVCQWSVAYLRFPYEGYEWAEGLLLNLAVRLNAGETLYPDANAEGAVGCFYPPVYPVVSGLAVRLLGPRLLAVRLVSVLATVAVTVLIVLEVWRRGRSAGLAAICGLMWIALNGPVRGRFVEGRVDMLFIAFMVGALVLFRRAANSNRALVGAVVVTALAIYTKHNAVFVATAGLSFVAFRGQWRRALAAGAALALLLGPPALWLQHSTEGGFLDHLFVLSHSGPRLGHFYRVVAFAAGVWPLLVVGLAWLVHGLVRNRRSLVSPYSLALIQFAPFSVIHHMTHGGGVSVHLPTLVSLILVLGTCSGGLLQGSRRTLGRGLVGLIVLVQVAVLPVLTDRPDEEDWQLGRAIEQCICEHDGPVLMFAYQSYLVRLGRPVCDCMLVARLRWVAGRWDPARMVGDLNRQKYGLVLTVPAAVPEPARRALEANYRPVGQFQPPRFGRPPRPLTAFEPISDPRHREGTTIRRQPTSNCRTHGPLRPAADGGREIR